MKLVSKSGLSPSKQKDMVMLLRATPESNQTKDMLSLATVNDTKIRSLRKEHSKPKNMAVLLETTPESCKIKDMLSLATTKDTNIRSSAACKVCCGVPLPITGDLLNVTVAEGDCIGSKSRETSNRADGPQAMFNVCYGKYLLLMLC